MSQQFFVNPNYLGNVHAEIHNLRAELNGLREEVRVLRGSVPVGLDPFAYRPPDSTPPIPRPRPWY